MSALADGGPLVAGLPCGIEGGVDGAWGGSGGEECGGGVEDFEIAAGIGDEVWAAAGHGLDDGERGALGVGGEDVQMVAGPEAFEIALVAGKADFVADAVVIDEILQ